MREHISKASDETLARIRLAHHRPVRSFFRNAVRTAEAWCYHPDVAMGWIRPAVKAILKLSNRRRPDVIWATAGPLASFFVAQKVSQQTRVPYVLDFRDAWTIIPTEFDNRRPRWARCLEQRKMFRLLNGAQAVIFRYDTEAECFWRAYQGALETSKIYIIPNGYEGKINEITVSKGARCNVLYTGTLSDYRYDTLLQALVCVRQCSAELATGLHFQFVGEGTEALGEQAAALGLSDMITISGPISHDNVIRLSREAHALLILGRPPTMKGYELFAAAKLFGYLKVGIPIIGVLPDDETKKVLIRVGVTTIADVDSQSEIVALLRRLLDVWAQGELSSLSPVRSACEIYSAERQTEELVRALSGTPALEPFVPGSAEIPPSLWSEICRIAREFEKKPPRTRRLCGERVSDISPLRRSAR